MRDVSCPRLNVMINLLRIYLKKEMIKSIIVKIDLMFFAHLLNSYLQKGFFIL